MKKLILALTIIVMVMFLQTSIYAQDDDMSLDKIYEKLPDDIKKYTVEDFDITSITSDIFKNGLDFSLKTFGTVTIFSLISIYINTLTNINDEKNYVVKFLSQYACTISVYSMIYTQIEVISLYAQRLSTLMSGFLLFSNSVLLYCGYITTAATSSAWIELIMSLIKSSVTTYLIPLIKILCGISLADHTICENKLNAFYNLCKNSFLWICSIIITLITTIMQSQTSLSKISDATSVQSIKFASTQAFPIVGGLVSESIRTVAGTANSAKNAGGAIVLTLIAIITLYPLSSLLGIKIGLYLSQIGADMFGNQEISNTINRSFSLINFMLTIIGLMASIFAITAITFMLQSLNIAQ